VQPVNSQKKSHISHEGDVAKVGIFSVLKSNNYCRVKISGFNYLITHGI